jgi:hypothetical protein
MRSRPDRRGRGDHWYPRRKAPPTTAARRYRLDLKTTQVIDLKAVGQTEQRQEFGSTGFLSVSIADTTGGKTISVVLDSLKPDSASPVPSEAAKAAAGTTWHGVVGSNGRITGLQASSENPVAVTLTALLREFLPPVPAGVPPGKAWTDTTENNDNVPNGSMAVRTITNFQSSSETYEGVKALKIASASSSSSGNQETEVIRGHRRHREREPESGTSGPTVPTLAESEAAESDGLGGSHLNRCPWL